MEAGLLRLEQAPEDRDNLNGIFRAAHTIKGGAGVIECRFIEHFTHGVENLLDALRNGDFAVTGGMATLLLECCDQMGDLIDVLAVLYVERDSQKGIVIGKGGARLREVGTAARTQIEKLLGTKVFLDLRVKVAKNWQRDPKQLGRLGF